MDSTGWHAHREARREQARFRAPERRPDGSFEPVERAGPVDDVELALPIPSPLRVGHHAGTPPPTPPAKDWFGGTGNGRAHTAPLAPTTSQSSQRSTESARDAALRAPVPAAMAALQQMSAAERAMTLRVARMRPYLQLMVGPLLRYDTVERGVWRGAALIVTVDASSTYDPAPVLELSWDPDRPVYKNTPGPVPLEHRMKSLDLGPHPLDPTSSVSSHDDHANGYAEPGPNAQREIVSGKELWVYYGTGGTCTFWRFMIEIPLAHNEMRVSYSINHGQEFNFCVPAINQNMRWATYSCNGFSSGVNPADFCGPGFYSGYDPVWTDLLAAHAATPFHALVGGGDQLYCDGIVREPELQEWVTQTRPERKKSFVLTEEMRLAIDRFYFHHYCRAFRERAFARANSSIPMVNMLDDHDLIDGFGSYPDDLMMSPVFGTIGSRGYFFFLLFQCFVNPEIDGLNDRKHPFKSTIIGAPGPYIPFPSHSILSYLGPNVSILLLDCRAERRKDQVCSQQEYRTVFARVRTLPAAVEHLVLQTGIPIAYPRMVFLETALESKMNPLTALGKAGSLGLSGFVNKFNADAELLDDLNDHWTATSHKKERNWLIEQLQGIARGQRCRVTMLAGDVHCAAVGLLRTLQRDKKAPALPPAQDFRYMLNVVTSAIVNTPPPGGVQTMVSTLATKTHRTLHRADTDETMVPVFEHDPDGSSPKSKYIMGRRNWCAVNWDPRTGELVFELRVEKVKGMGETAGYPVRAPPPRW